jgi:hypothetical protein
LKRLDFESSARGRGRGRFISAANRSNNAPQTWAELRIQFQASILGKNALFSDAVIETMFNSPEKFLATITTWPENLDLRVGYPFWTIIGERSEIEREA